MACFNALVPTLPEEAIQGKLHHGSRPPGHETVAVRAAGWPTQPRLAVKSHYSRH